MTYPITLTQGIGYSGAQGERAYVARIGGSDQRYGLAREFVEPARVERDHFGRPRYIRTYHYELTPGLYELSSRGERWYRIVAAKRESPDLGCWSVTQERLDAMVRLMDAGSDFAAARHNTKPVAS